MNPVNRKNLLSISILYLSFLVWSINGLVAKILNFVPRHEDIVARILSPTYARELIILIGIGELFIAVWILSGWKSRLCTWSQLFLIISMNALEFLLAPDLLLFGRFNIVIALMFCLLIYQNEYKFRQCV